MAAKVTATNFNLHNAKSVVIIVVLIVIVLGVVFLGKDIINIIKSIGDSLSGATKSLTTPLGNTANSNEIDAANNTIAATDKDSISLTSPFNPALYTNNVGYYDSAFDDETATTYATTVNGSIGFFASYAGDALSAIQNAHTQMDVSHIAWAYTQKYNANMWDAMSQGYDSAANKEILAQISNYAKALPQFQS